MAIHSLVEILLEDNVAYPFIFPVIYYFHFVYTPITVEQMLLFVVLKTVYSSQFESTSKFCLWFILSPSLQQYYNLWPLLANLATTKVVILAECFVITSVFQSLYRMSGSF